MKGSQIGDYTGATIRVVNGDTRSLDSSSFARANFRGVARSFEL